MTPERTPMKPGDPCYLITRDALIALSAKGGDQ